MVLEKGKKVKISYIGRFESGEIFDATSMHGKPLEFIIGEKMVIPGFENAVKDMKVNEEKEVTLLPKDAYGDVNPEAIQKVPASQFPEGAKEGMQIGIPLPNGKAFPAIIKKIEKDFVTIDMNHPLAGKKLIFNIKLLEVS